jgi:hypothetical protein
VPFLGPAPSPLNSYFPDASLVYENRNWVLANLIPAHGRPDLVDFIARNELSDVQSATDFGKKGKMPPMAAKRALPSHWHVCC